jgi:hypothetical protein
MGTQQKDLLPQASGSIFQINQAYFTVSNPPGPKQGFTLVVHNQSGEWVDAVVDRDNGIAQTGHIQNNEDGGFTEPVAKYLYAIDWTNKVTRWRPGFLRIPGNGGGEIVFKLPPEAESVMLEITIKG